MAGACENGESFASKKAKALQHGDNANLKGISLSEAEVKFEESILQPAIKDSAIDSTKSFLDGKSEYDKSPLLPLMKRLPKGAVLHTHGIASTGMQDVVDLLKKDGHFYIWQGGEGQLEGTIKAFADGVKPEEGWVPAVDFPSDKLYGYLTLPSGLTNVDEFWATFGNMWQRLLPGTGVAPFYLGENGMLWRILERFFATGVIYVEIKESIYTPLVEYDETPLTDDQFVQAFADTVAKFCEKNAGFVGAKLIPTCVKFQSPEMVEEGLMRCIAMKEKFPDVIAGFDLAGAEDLPSPIATFEPAIHRCMKVAEEKNIDLPLLLHAGETNKPDGEQIVDAVLLGCRRIGHGFALARHPALIEKVKDMKSSLECNPLSNQVLGYFPDLAAHSSLGLFRSGVIMTISPDDPGMWHCDDVSYDFAAVAKAWRLSLAEIKAFCRNSITESTLDTAKREAALASWEQLWQRWIDTELAEAGAK
mmetsp:Transcript_59652/g.141945  ORF Transcript_59652/g.141945 Transcript_59652/m.141945 type:complete len:476 (-) Transcript_59652:39-1466(-)